MQCLSVNLIATIFVDSKHLLSTPITNTCQQLPESTCPPRDLCFNLRIYSYGTSQQILVQRGNLKLLIVTLQYNSGLCYYVVWIRKTSFVGGHKPELEVMKSLSVNFLPTFADWVARHYLRDCIFCGFFIGSTQFMTYFQCAIVV